MRAYGMQNYLYRYITAMLLHMLPWQEILCRRQPTLKLGLKTKMSVGLLSVRTSGLPIKSGMSLCVVILHRSCFLGSILQSAAADTSRSTLTAKISSVVSVSVALAEPSASRGMRDLVTRHCLAGPSPEHVQVKLSVVKTGTATVRTGMEGLYLATSRAVLPPLVRTTIRAACTCKSRTVQLKNGPPSPDSLDREDQGIVPGIWIALSQRPLTSNLGSLFRLQTVFCRLLVMPCRKSYAGLSGSEMCVLSYIAIFAALTL